MFEIKRGILTSEQFNVLTESVGWGHRIIEQVEYALKNSLYTVCIKEGDKIIAMARMIGDNSMSYFIKDVVVIPEYQGKVLVNLLLMIFYLILKKAHQKIGRFPLNL